MVELAEDLTLLSGDGPHSRDEHSSTTDSHPPPPSSPSLLHTGQSTYMGHTRMQCNCCDPNSQSFFPVASA